MLLLLTILSDVPLISQNANVMGSYDVFIAVFCNCRHLNMSTPVIP